LSPTNAREHASEIVQNYWASVPKTELGVKKRGRPSNTASAPPRSGKASKTARQSTASNGRKARAAVEEDEESVVVQDYFESHVDPMTKYEDVEDWEELVASVDSVERGSDGELMVYLTM
jgi:hypothetical protein